MERLQSDTEKILAISQSMIQPNHPYQGFTHGNRGTLIVNPRRQNINMLAGLRKFYEEYYSANIMCLCVSKKLGMIFRVRYNNLKHTEHMIMMSYISVLCNQIYGYDLKETVMWDGKVEGMCLREGMGLRGSDLINDQLLRQKSS